jgi:hypothetical protein
LHIFAGSFNYAFTGCSSLKSIVIPNLDLSLVNGMYSVFQGCSSLISLDLSNLHLDYGMAESAYEEFYIPLISFLEKKD